MPDPTCANACTAVIAGGHIVIIDTGPGSWRNIAQARLPAEHIDTILFTHLHSDHIGDLGEFAVQSWIADRVTPLNIWGPAELPAPTVASDDRGHKFGAKSVFDVVNGFSVAYDEGAAYRIIHHGANYLAPDGADMVGHEIPTPKVDELVSVSDRDGLKISAFLVDHGPVKPAYGCRVEYNERLAKMTNDTINYHTTSMEAAEIANAAHVKLLVFSHIVPPLPNRLATHMFMQGVEPIGGGMPMPFISLLNCK